MIEHLDPAWRRAMHARQLIGVRIPSALLACFLYLACSDLTPSEPDTDSADAAVVRVTRADPTILPLDSTFTLRVFGSGFRPDSRVVLTVNGEPTPKVRTNATLFVSPQQLDASITTAADAPGGPYDIVVEGRTGKQGVGTELVDLRAHVFGISPGSADLGAAVTISGINFGSDRARVTVTFDGVAALVQSVSNTRIVVAVPTSLAVGLVRVEVMIAGIPASPAVLLEVGFPRILIRSISPSPAARGDEVTISGSGFGRVRDEIHPLVDGRPVRVLSVDDSTLVVGIPFDAAIGMVAVEISATRFPFAPHPAEAFLEVIPRRALYGTWILSGSCCRGVGPDLLGGSFSISEASDGSLQGSLAFTLSGHSISGPLEGRVKLGGVLHTPLFTGAGGEYPALAISFKVDSCEFTGHLITAQWMDGLMGGCAGATGGGEAGAGWWDYGPGGPAVWEAERQ